MPLTVYLYCPARMRVVLINIGQFPPPHAVHSSLGDSPMPYCSKSSPHLGQHRIPSSLRFRNPSTVAISCRNSANRVVESLRYEFTSLSLTISASPPRRCILSSSFPAAPIAPYTVSPEIQLRSGL